jgi:formate dehydrogenase major subunit
VHVEGDTDNPVNKGTLCPKGAGLLDMIDSPDRLQFPEVREPGSKEFKRISWEEALTRIAKRMKADRDKNFVAKNADGLTVNRWNTFGMLVSSASNNESGYMTAKILRSMGVVALDTQARI